jgi:hypothetical protein
LLQSRVSKLQREEAGVCAPMAATGVMLDGPADDVDEASTAGAGAKLVWSPAKMVESEGK